MKITIIKASNGIHDYYDSEVEGLTSQDFPLVMKIVEIIEEENKKNIERA
jgi:hypothetical protein